MSRRIQQLKKQAEAMRRRLGAHLLASVPDVLAAGQAPQSPLHRAYIGMVDSMGVLMDSTVGGGEAHERATAGYAASQKELYRVLSEYGLS